MNVRWGRIAAFYVTTILATQAAGVLVAALRGPAKKGDMFEWGLRANLAMLVPGVVALMFARFVLREPASMALGLRFRPNRWWLLAWLLPAFTVGASIGLRLLAPETALAPHKGPWSALPLPPHWGVLVAGLLAGATVCLPGALGEELAWRGLLRRELAPLGFWRSCVLIGLLWAGWHMPAVILGGYAGGSAAAALGLTLKLLIATPIALALCERGGSVMAAALWHASGSGMLAASMMVKGGQGPFAVIASYLPGLVLLLVLVLFPKLRRQSGNRMQTSIADPAMF